MKKKELVNQLRQLPDDSEVRINGNDFEIVKIIRRSGTSVELEVLPSGVACESCKCEEPAEETPSTELIQ